MRIVLVSLVSLFLISCDALSGDVVSVDVSGDMKKSMESHTFFYDLTSSNDILVPAGGVSVAKGSEGVTLNGGDPSVRAGGNVAAARLVVSGDTEAFLSGKDIKVHVLAKSNGGSGLNVGYSTRNVGNSGWEFFRLSEDYYLGSFGYSVPQMKEPNTDFLGLLPVGGEVNVVAISIDVASE